MRSSLHWLKASAWAVIAFLHVPLALIVAPRPALGFR